MDRPLGNLGRVSCAPPAVNWKAAWTSAWLCGLFLLVYGGTNYLASLRANVGTLHFEWERRIPFVPWMILPYMSIDLFFIAAPFLCGDEMELRVVRRRLAGAILICGAFFLVLPLRFAFARPAVTGWLGSVFNNFRKLDRPFNLVPSLHIALCVILADLYLRHSRGILRLALGGWFILIGISTLLT